MVNIQIPDISGAWRHHKTAILGGAVLAVVILGAVAAIGGFVVFNVQGEAWDVSVYLYGGKVGDYEYIIPSSMNTNNLPIQVVAVTGSSLTLNPDRAGANVNSNGGQPQIILTETQVWHTDHNGINTPSSVADTSYVNNQFGDGLNWYLHYYKVTVEIRTQVELCKDTVNTGWGGLGYPINTYERQSVNAKFYLAINLISSTSNNSFKSKFADGKIASDAQTGSIPTDPDYSTLDTRALMKPDYTANNQLLPFTTTGSGGNTIYVFQVSAQINGGVLYTYGSANDIEGIKQQVDVWVRYTLLLGFLVSTPPLLPNRAQQVMGDHKDINPALIFNDPIATFFNALQSGALTWLIVGVTVFLVVVAGLVAYKRYGHNAQRVSPSRRGK